MTHAVQMGLFQHKGIMRNILSKLSIAIDRFYFTILLRRLRNGRFRRILGPEKFLEFAQFASRQASIPHQKEFVLRVTVGDIDCIPWYIWIVYQIIQSDPLSFEMDRLYMPSSVENIFDVPLEISGMDYFPA